MAKQSAGAAIPPVPPGNETNNPSHGGPPVMVPDAQAPISPAVARPRHGAAAAQGHGNGGNGGGGSGK